MYKIEPDNTSAKEAAIWRFRCFHTMQRLESRKLYDAQRSNRARNPERAEIRAFGILTDEQAEKLDDIGMRWESVRDLAWEKNYSAAKAYYGEHGDLKIPADYVVNGVWLARWLFE